MHTKPFKIYQGGKAVFQVNILNKETRTPFDLTGATQIHTCFTNDDGTELMLSLSSGVTIQGNPILGQILISLTAAQTALLIPVQLGTLELAITLLLGSDPIKTQILNAYDVLASVC